MIRSLFIIALLLLTTGLAAACGGNGTGDGPDANGASPGSTESRAQATADPLIDALREQLDAIGVNIGAVPDDVRDQILASCAELEELVEAVRRVRVCAVVEVAIEQGDPGLIDQILDELEDLEDLDED